MTHIDDWLDTHKPANKGEQHAMRFLEFARGPAHGNENRGWMGEHPLFCTYKGETHRCTGASRLGDVWLTKDLSQDRGYQLRIYVDECFEWREQP